MVNAKKFSWFFDEEPGRCLTLLRATKRKGTFLVRLSSTKMYYVLLVIARENDSRPEDTYKIIMDDNRRYRLENDRYTSASLADLIQHLMECDNHSIPLLRYTPKEVVPRATSTRVCPITRDWHIDFRELELLSKLGQGSFGMVSKARFRGIDVAVKTMIEGAMSEDLFVKEAQIMFELKHPHIVRLVGVCTREHPLFIVTEYMSHGCLLMYLVKYRAKLMTNVKALRSICTQVSEGMAYLESKNFIHRDLAARNCLVGEGGVVKVSDFGMSRFMTDTMYKGRQESQVPAFSIPPEVIQRRLFSTKSDVWAFGMLMWEVFSGGASPLGHMKPSEAMKHVNDGYLFPKPKVAESRDFAMMKICCMYDPKKRPTFAEISRELRRMSLS